MASLTMRQCTALFQLADKGASIVLNLGKCPTSRAKWVVETRAAYYPITAQVIQSLAGRDLITMDFRHNLGYITARGRLALKEVA